MFKLKLQLFKFLGIFIPYFKRKYMDTVIYNHLKNTINYRIKVYGDNEFFVKTLAKSTKPYSVKYVITYKNVNFSIEAEYINNQIKFDFSSDGFNTIEEFDQIHDFVKHIKSMSQEDFKRKIDIALGN